jgi:hypothetical protein
MAAKLFTGPGRAHPGVEDRPSQDDTQVRTFDPIRRR